MQKMILLLPVFILSSCLSASSDVQTKTYSGWSSASAYDSSGDKLADNLWCTTDWNKNTDTASLVAFFFTFVDIDGCSPHTICNTHAYVFAQKLSLRRDGNNMSIGTQMQDFADSTWNDTRDMENGFWDHERDGAHITLETFNPSDSAYRDLLNLPAPLRSSFLPMHQIRIDSRDIKTVAWPCEDFSQNVSAAALNADWGSYRPWWGQDSNRSILSARRVLH